MAERGGNLGFGGTLSAPELRRLLGVSFVDGVQARLYTQANAFQFGNLVTAGSTWTLATMDARGQQADGLVVRATDSEFWVAVSTQPIRWEAHGFGASGDLWLGSSGSPTATEPVGSSLRNLQRVGRIVGANEIILRIEHPVNL